MIVLYARDRRPGELEALHEVLEAEGVRYQVLTSREDRVVCSVDGPEDLVERLLALDAVESAHHFQGPWGLVGRDVRSSTAQVPLGDVVIGGDGVVVIAGPCSVETPAQLEAAATAVREAGGHGLRGGAYKPRTSPHDFQGLGRDGLLMLERARENTGLPVVTEVMTPEDVDLVAEHADVLQVGSRNVQNFRLLEAVGRSDRPVLLKRGMMSTIDEFLAAAEYIFVRENEQIILCERGIRTFEPRLRNTLDLGAVAMLKRLSHLPVIVDPSHGTGVAAVVPDLSRAALAVGGDGLLIEIHPQPEVALSDGHQALSLEVFSDLMADLRGLADHLGRPFASPAGETATRPARA